MRAELIKRLVVKRPGVRARGDMIGIPLPNILDRWACKWAAAKAPQRKRPCRSRALPVDPYFVMRALSVAKGSGSLCVAVERTIAPRRKSLLALQRLQNPRGLAANAENLLRCIGRSRWARNLSTLHLQNRMSKGARHGHLSRRVSQTFRAEMEKSH